MDFDISKLRALNTLNLEIWTRLAKCIDSGTFRYAVLDKVSFAKNVLSFSTTSMVIPLPPLSVPFQNVNNLFKDVLPTTTYFDLSSVINSYELLNPSKSLAILQSWKVALEEVQVLLGNIETKMNDDLALSVKITAKFSLDALEVLKKVIVCTPITESVSLEFTIPCTANHMKEISKLAAVVFGLYTTEIIDKPSTTTTTTATKIGDNDIGYFIGAIWTNSDWKGNQWVITNIAGNKCSYSNFTFPASPPTVGNSTATKDDVINWNKLYKFKYVYFIKNK